MTTWLQTVKEISFTGWRDYDTEDTVCFYAFQLREAGMIENSGAIWRAF